MSIAFPSRSQKNRKRKKAAYVNNSIDRQRLRWRFLACAEEIGQFQLAWKWRFTVVDWPDPDPTLTGAFAIPDEKVAREWWNLYNNSDAQGVRDIPEKVHEIMRRRITNYVKYLLVGFISDNVEANKDLLDQAREGKLNPALTALVQHTTTAVTFGSKQFNESGNGKSQGISFGGGLTINTGAPRRARIKAADNVKVLEAQVRELAPGN